MSKITALAFIGLLVMVGYASATITSCYQCTGDECNEPEADDCNADGTYHYCYKTVFAVVIYTLFKMSLKFLIKFVLLVFLSKK